MVLLACICCGSLDGAQVRPDKKGRPYVSCLHCAARTFPRSTLAIGVMAWFTIQARAVGRPAMMAEALRLEDEATGAFRALVAGQAATASPTNGVTT